MDLVGSLTQFIDTSQIFYSERARAITTQLPPPNKLKLSKDVSPTWNQKQDTLNKLRRYKAQFEMLKSGRQKKPEIGKAQQISAKVEQAHRKSPPLRPLFLGLFSHKKAYEADVRSRCLKSRHHLLRTLHQIKQQQNREQTNTLVDTAFKKLNAELNDDSQQRQQERQLVLAQYERLKRISLSIQQPRNEQLSEESGSDLEERKPLKAQQSRKRTKPRRPLMQLVQKFPEEQWCKVRGYSTAAQHQQEEEETVFHSSIFIEKIKMIKQDPIESLNEIIRDLNSKLY